MSPKKFFVAIRLLLRKAINLLAEFLLKLLLQVQLAEMSFLQKVDGLSPTCDRVRSSVNWELFRVEDAINGLKCLC